MSDENTKVLVPTDPDKFLEFLADSVDTKADWGDSSLEIIEYLSVMTSAWLQDYDLTKNESIH